MQTLNKLQRYWQFSLVSCLVLSGAIAPVGNPTLAQVIGDDTLGAESSLVDSPIPDGFLIEGGATRGTNLFHSFSQFSLPTDGIAYFNNALNIQNIISRVTGGSISNIDGLITANGRANLFLINPNGIIFGPNASLDIGGSFIGSTANSLIFENNFEFSANNPQAPPLLTINVPVGLQSGGNPGSIQVQGSGLSVLNGQTLALVGGDVQLDGASLQATSGRVELGGLAAGGTIGIAADNGNLRLNFPQDTARRDVSVNDTEINVTSRGGGSITIYGDNLTIDRSLVVSGISGFRTVGAQAGNITLDATGEVKIGQNSIVASSVFRTARGNTGNIEIKARTFQLTDGATLGTFVFGQGNAGKIIVQAKDSVLLTGHHTIISSSLAEGAQGQAGEVNIQTNLLSLADDAQIGAITGGRGNAGKIFIQANDSVSLTGRLTGILSNVGPDAEGEGGDINIKTGSLFLTDDAGLTASTFGRGGAGNIFVQADKSIVLVNSQISSAVREEGIGQGGEINLKTGLLSLSEGAALDSSVFGQGSGGDINIETDSLSLTEDSALVAATLGQGNAGNIFVRANNSVSLNNGNIFTVVDSEAVGRGGEINIQTGLLSLIEQSNISSNTFGQGDSGSIFIQTNDAVLLAESGIATGVYTDAIGDGGDISVKTRLLSLTNGSQLFAGTFGNGNSGNIQVDASESVSVAGVAPDPDGFSTGLFTSTEEGATGQGGDIRVTTGILRVSDRAVLSAITGTSFQGGNINVDVNTLEATNGGQLLTSAFSSADAGSITVNATQSVTLAGSDPTFAQRLAQFGADIVDNDGPASGLFARTAGAGAAGDVIVNTAQMTVQDGAQVSASTSGGTGGSITVTANSFDATNGGQLRTTTTASKNAGDITLRVGDDVSLAGANTGLFANTEPGSSGNGGSIFINPKTIDIRDGAEVTVSGRGSGSAGDVTITANSIRLDQGKLTAETNAGEGANIELNQLNLLLMQNQSLISAQAFNNANGGNINIDAGKGFVIATLSQNNDVIANAFQGQGGEINITTQGIFGLQERRATPGNRTNDIDASSEFGLAGTVIINSPDVDPSRGLVQLPTEPANVQVAQGCQAGGSQASVAFFNIGRGGLAPNPYEPLSSSNIWEDVSSPTQKPQNPTAATPPEKIVEAQGWHLNEKGQLVLVAGETGCS